MKTNLKKFIGIYMDHAEAKFIEPGKPTSLINAVPSGVTSHVRIEGESSDGTRLGNFRSTNDESHKHFREQNAMHIYFSEIADVLLPYDEIYLFGPTTARKEFHNFLLGEKGFSDKKITVAATDYLTENQMVQNVNGHFGFS